MKPQLDRFLALIVASDPTFARLRMGTRVTATLIAIVLALVLVHGLWPLPVAAYGVAVITAMQGALQIKDRTDRQRLVSRVYCAIAGFVSAVVASLLLPWPALSHAAFILLVFVAVYTRKYGVRWNAVGMFAFMCFFIASYLQPAPGDLPGVALAILLSAAIAHVVRRTVLPERPAEEFRRALQAAFQRIGDLELLLRTGRREGWTNARRRAVHRAQDRIGEAVLIADACLPTKDGATTGEDPAAGMAVALFDLHLASETAMLAALSQTSAEAATASDAAIDRLHGLVAQVRRDAGSLPDALFLRSAASPILPAAAARPAPGFLQDPALKLAIQVALASALAMTAGLALSKTRWFWAVMTAFLVFVNTQSRGDTALRALNRAVGTLGGIVIGIGLATLLHGAFLASALLIVLFTFVGFYLLQLSYGAMTFCVTIVLSLLYGLLGEFTPGLLLLRLEETLIGSLAGALIAFAVFPQTTTITADKAVDAFLSALDRVLAAAASGIEKGRPGAGILALARHVDRRNADLATAVRPLGSNWQIVTRPGTVRRTLLHFMAAAYWTRIFAKALSGETLDAERSGRLQASIAALRRRIAAARARKVHFFGDAGAAQGAARIPRFSPDDATASDPLLALDVLSRVLSRLAPEVEDREGLDSRQD